MRSRSTTPALSALSLGYFSLGTTSLAVVGLDAPIATGLHVAPAHVGFLVTVFAITFALAAPFAPAVLGGRTRKQALLIGLGLLAGGAVLSAAAPTYPALLATRVLAALGAAVFGPAASATGSLLVPAERRNRALAVVFAGMTVAAVVGVPVASFLGSHLGWRPALGAVAALAIGAFASVAALVPALPGGEPSTARAYGTALRASGALATVMTTLLFMAAQFTVYGIASAYLEARFDASDNQISATLLAFGLVGIVGTVTSAPLAGRLGGNHTVAVAIGGLSAAFVMLLFAPHGTSGLFLFVLWAFFSQLYQAPQQGRLVALLPEQAGLILALNASALYLGISLGSVIGSTALPVVGEATIPALALALAAAAAVTHTLACRRFPPDVPSATVSKEMTTDATV